MRWRTSLFTGALTSALALAALYPALGQRSPQSILPPGFGEPEPPANANTPKPPPAPPATPRPDNESLPAAAVPPDAIGNLAGLDLDVSNTLDNAALAVVPPMDLPPEAQRSLDAVGLVSAESGGFARDAWGDADGRFLSGLMARTKAPIASRWLSIVLRRALIAQAQTPAAIGGADWVAARAWLLVRMGEADNARALVAAVDNDNYTPWLATVAMQTALATGDPAALCGIADGPGAIGNDAAWLLARAMCAGLSGEGGTATGLVEAARRTRRARGVDVLLAEKVMGAGSNTRRAVTIQWDDVEKLNAWRFGLASATGVVIPERLMATAGPQVRAWQARAPLFTPQERASAANRAAILGVFSSAALVDLYGAIYDDTDPSERGGTTGEALRDAYAGDGSARVAGLRSLWGASDGNPLLRYARLILGARAAARILPADGSGAADDMVASMMAAGLDLQAARWGATVSGGSLGWGLLAVGAPRVPFAVDEGGVARFRSEAGATGAQRARFLFAALAGLGRLPADRIGQLAQDYEVPIGRETAWTRALDRAVMARQPATVVLLCAAGMQVARWSDVPPAHLYRIIAALRAVGLEPEARMIGAEALTRA